MRTDFRWHFPVSTCHDGPWQGNARLGVMLWGEGKTLKLTLGRADLWDHRGGMPWTDEMSYSRIHELLLAKDAAGMQRVFERPPTLEQGLERPAILPLGRVELELPGLLHSALLDPATGVVTITYDGGTVDIELAPRDCVVLVRGAARARASAHPSGTSAKGEWGSPATAWTERKLPPPQQLDRHDLAGWAQHLPADPAVCVGWRAEGNDLYLVCERGHDTDDAVAEASTLLSRAITEGTERFSADARAWWSEFWSQCPRVSVPNPHLQFMYTYGMYRLGGSTNPRGVPCGLQGPWIEDYRIPPWSSDYHFNINVQMCYAPAYPGGLGRHFKPLWKMLEAWEPSLQDNARKFIGIPDGLMLPHSVDDRCTNMGGFWAGTIDHGCTAWTAKMMFDAWDYGFEDDAFLAGITWRWLVGALKVYLAMAQTRPDGTVAFPVSVSPEYRSSDITAWGANASFQLAACHAVLDALHTAAAHLGREFPPEWARFREQLPRACVQEFGGRKQIMLWEGTPLGESHRHHSHLAGIAPFESFDPLSKDWHSITDASLARWVDRGTGQWSGWCHSWASQLMSRVNNPQAAEWFLTAFNRWFVSPGGAPYHNVFAPGYSLMGASGLGMWGWQAMQLDGAMGSTAAIFDMLCHVRKAEGNVHHFFAGTPAEWGDLAFEHIATPGGFRVSASRKAGRLASLTVRSTRPGTFRYHHNGAIAEAKLPANTTTALL